VDHEVKKKAADGGSGSKLGISKTSKAKLDAGTDWNKLRHMSDAQIRRGIASVWKDTKVVWPT
jgi:hypothetical protein